MTKLRYYLRPSSLGKTLSDLETPGLACVSTLASALWVGVALPGLPLLSGLDAPGQRGVAISLQSALLGIFDGASSGAWPGWREGASRPPAALARNARHGDLEIPHRVGRVVAPTLTIAGELPPQAQAPSAGPTAAGPVTVHPTEAASPTVERSSSAPNRDAESAQDPGVPGAYAASSSTESAVSSPDAEPAPATAPTSATTSSSPASASTPNLAGYAGTANGNDQAAQQGAGKEESTRATERRADETTNEGGPTGGVDEQPDARAAGEPATGGSAGVRGRGSEGAVTDSRPAENRTNPLEGVPATPSEESGAAQQGRGQERNPGNDRPNGPQDQGSAQVRNKTKDEGTGNASWTGGRSHEAR